MFNLVVFSQFLSHISGRLEIHPSISPKEGDTVVQKWTPDSFHETNFQKEDVKLEEQTQRNNKMITFQKIVMEMM